MSTSARDVPRRTFLRLIVRVDAAVRARDRPKAERLLAEAERLASLGQSREHRLCMERVVDVRLQRVNAMQKQLGVRRPASAGINTARDVRPEKRSTERLAPDPQPIKSIPSPRTAKTGRPRRRPLCSRCGASFDADSKGASKRVCGACRKRAGLRRSVRTVSGGLPGLCRRS